LVKEKFYRLQLINKVFFFLKIIFIYYFLSIPVFANIKQNLINKLTSTKTLSFNFEQKISDKKEIGKCIIKYPLLMKCNYENLKQKIIISNGKKLAIIKKKYKKIYFYPIKSTPLFTILQKEEIYKIVRKVNPKKIDSNTVEFLIIDEKNNSLRIFFDTNTLNLKGWKTTDPYSNEVLFLINDLKINNIFEDNIFKIPRDKDL
tara:strand:- start:8906 stop:9514 length:609 start_codon:yes stop_codon:yes gene_type:complete